MPVQALIFDVDGTLSETEEAHRRAFNETFAEQGLGWHWTQDDYRRLLRTTGGKERMRAYTVETGQDIPDARIADLHRIKTARYGEILASGDIDLRPGVADLIARAKASGIRVAVATTTNAPNVEALTRACWGQGADEIFEVIAAGDMVEAKKPAPDVFLLALEKLGLDPSVCLAFEDSLNGLNSARAAGQRTIVTPSIYTDHEDFTGASAVLSDLLGFNPCDYD